MKRRFTILAAAFTLLAFLAIPMGLRATDVTFSYSDYTGQGTQSTGSEVTMGKTDVDITNTKFFGNTNYAHFYAGGTTTITPKNGAIITKIVLTATGTSYNGYQSGGTITVSTGSVSANGTTVTWTGSSSDAFTLANNKQIRWTSIVVTYSTNSNAVDTPTFTPNGGIFLDSQEVSISCTTSGATIQYSTNDGSTWTNYTTPFTLTATTTVQAKAIKSGMTDSEIATATFTKTAPLTTMQAIFNKATEVGGTATEVFVTLDSWVVSGVSTNGKNVFVTDGTKGFVIYDNGGNMGFSAGDILSGTVYCKVQLYHGFAELTLLNATTTGISVATGGTVAAANIAMAELAGVNTGALVHYDNLTCSVDNNNYYLSDGTTTIQVYNSLYDFGSALVANHSYNITGVYQQYNTTKEVLPRSADDIEEVVSTEPTIIVSDATVNVGAEGAEGTITVLYDNIDEIVANVYFCDAESVAATYSWITAEMNDDDNVDYIVSANTGATRTAYMKVRVGNVYSNLITINQAVAEYATLPFEFDGGRADIENTAGLTGFDLGSDYSSSPKLKFNNANETISTLILKFNEVPGLLTYDIKGNTFSGGTFKVQTSEDGETYTDLETYTEFGTNGNSAFNESFDNLGENVRYIKWIYTEKVTGNVGLGNIHLYELGGGPVTEYDLTVEPFENLEIFTFVGGDENNPFEGAGTIQVNVGDQVMLSITANEGYVIQSLMVDGVEHVNDITDDETYTFTMPDHNVTISATAVEDVPPTPFEPVTYTLATTIESGKTYIIVGSKTIDEETHYYAMGAQRDNNRAGVVISVDGTTATVETADVHEVVITALEEEGFYSIYDGGYLYAAGSNKNYLRTQDSLDVNAKWSISIDTVSHIVADSSANRNVMQFNYNNGTPIFSCYGSDSQLPVYLYVKDETQTTVTQTLALTAGTNWISTYVDITLDDLKDALVAALPGTTMMIKAKDAYTTYNGSRWRGQLNTLDLAQMYMITVSSDCEITLEGEPVNPAELTINISNGPNWIAFPFSESMTVANAFADFSATSGDMLKSMEQYTAYNGSRWRGQLNTLVPGQGFIYNSVSSEVKPFTYPTNTK
jgi:hypothetical protein